MTALTGHYNWHWGGSGDRQNVGGQGGSGDRVGQGTGWVRGQGGSGDRVGQGTGWVRGQGGSGDRVGQGTGWVRGQGGSGVGEVGVRVSYERQGNMGGKVNLEGGMVSWGGG